MMIKTWHTNTDVTEFEPLISWINIIEDLPYNRLLIFQVRSRYF